MPERNALAELAEEAEELKRVLEDLKFDRRVVVCDKLQRIVAELAKVDELRNKHSKTDADIAMYNTMLSVLPINCSAIAEEEV